MSKSGSSCLTQGVPLNSIEVEDRALRVHDDLALFLGDGGVGGGPVQGVGEQVQADAWVERLNITLYEIQFVLVGLLSESLLEPLGGGAVLYYRSWWDWSGI